MIDIDDFVQARVWHPGRARKVRLVVVHATQSRERAGAARATARYFASDEAKGSAHVTCDDRETIGSVRPEDTAAGAPGANEDGFHIEQVGFSEQAAGDWGDPYSRAVVVRAAKAAREACAHFGIPRVWLTVDDVRAGKAGVTDHNTITLATGKGSHWDPGPGWPRQRFMDLLAPTQPASEEDDEMKPHWVRIGTDERAAWVHTDGRVFDKLEKVPTIGAELKSSLDAVYIAKVANQRQVDVVQSWLNNLP